MNLESLLNSYSEYAVPALVTLVGLLVLLMLIRTIGARGTGRRGSRLGVSEFHEIDKSRRLVLLRRDDVEHLVMIGGNQDLVIESQIGAKAGETRPIQSSATASLDVKPRLDVKPALDPVEDPKDDDSVTKLIARPPKPAVFGDRAPNLRPVERAEPQLTPTESESKSS